MEKHVQASDAQDALVRHLDYLKSDPENLNLLADTAEIAMGAGAPETAIELAIRLQYSGAGTYRLKNSPEHSAYAFWSSRPRSSDSRGDTGAGARQPCGPLQSRLVPGPATQF